MRGMEEDSRGEFSEDEHPSTDASEDSVEVHVAPISRPYPPNLSRLPRKFRKAFERTSLYPGQKSPSEFRGDITASPESPPQERATSLSPVDFSVTSSVTTGRVSLACPPSPPSTARVRGSRRKPSEPRRVVEQESIKRPVEEEWHPRKTPRTELPIGTPLPPSNVTSSPHTILGPNPFLSHFVPPQFLLPPSWAHVARHPYAHLVGLAPQLGLLPGGHYPLLPILSSRLPVPQPISPNPPAPNDSTLLQGNKLHVNDCSSKRANGLTEGPLLQISKSEYSLSSGESQQLQPIIVPSACSLSAAPSSSSASPGAACRKFPPKPSPNSFHSVESLLSTKPPKEEDVEIEEDDEFDLSHDPSSRGGPESPSHDDTIQCLLQNQSRQKQRNYKNMTRERRIEANARERTRVHTISAAFDTLRQSVPSFSHNQKLSKLSVLRIASAYILSLSRLAGEDYSHGETSPSFEECVDLTTKTIQIEGKAKKKRDD